MRCKINERKSKKQGVNYFKLESTFNLLLDFILKVTMADIKNKEKIKKLL